MTTTSDGQTRTRMSAQGQDAFSQPADQLFYMVGKDNLLSVPGEEMAPLLEEMRLLEALVENQQEATARLKTCQDKYIQIKQSSYFIPEDRVKIEQSDSVEALAQQVRSAQSDLDASNHELREAIKPLTQLSDNTNNVTELIPIQRRGNRSSVAGFKMTYVRSEKIKNHWRKYKLSSKADTEGAEDSVITNGKVDWKKLKQQLTDVKESTSIKTDITWFDEWTKLDEQSIELFQWSERINEDLSATGSIQTGGDHEMGSQKVDLSAEAQLMRWSYGASGVSGEFNPFKKKASIKASGHAELMLAQAKASIDCYEPPGGYMMAFAGANLGMLRSHTILSVAGGIGASVATELNIEADFSGSGAKAKGISGSSRSRGLPGATPVDMSVPDNEQGVELGAFVGGQLEATVAGQVEWKSPESEKFEPFAKIAPAIAGQAGIGGEATLKISYQGGKFRILAKAALCYGVGAKGKLTLEVDATLIYEFAKWVAYQLKSIDYSRLDFIESDAYEVLSDIIVMAIQYGEDLHKFMLETSDLVRDFAAQSFNELQQSLGAAGERGELVQRINRNPDILRYTTPDAKGALLYRLMQVNAFDNTNIDNRTTDVSDINFWRFGYMTNRKRAIINVFTWVQSKEEYKNVMQRITPSIGKKVSSTEGESSLLEFLSRGELPLLSSDYPGNLQRFYKQLREKANKGSTIIRNDMTEYLTQNNIDPSFNKPCFNATQCKIETKTA